MNNSKHRLIQSAALLAIGGLVLAGCTTKGGSESGGADGDIKTGEGVDGTTITLGIVGDLTGPFSVLTTDHNRGVELYWDQINEAGGVCGQFTVELDIVDHGYNVQNAVSMYAQTSPNVLAYQDFVGGSHTMAVLEQAERENKIILPSSSTRHLTESDVVLVPAPTYDVDAELVIHYLVENGLLAEGDSVANIYVEGDYGESALSGVERAAEELGLTVLPYQVTAADTDMTAPVQDATAKGAAAIMMSGVPAHTASAATVLDSIGADIPLGGSWPSYASTLLDTAAGDYLVEHFHAGSPSTTYDTAAGAELWEQLTEAYPGEAITNQASMGYGAAAVLHQVLEAACDAGDLTPEGVVAARLALEPVDTDGILPLMDYSERGGSPTSELFMFTMDRSVPGGLKAVGDGTPYSLSE